MPLSWIVAVIVLTSLGSLAFSTLTYSLRDLARARFADYLQRHGLQRWLDPTLDHLEDLIVLTAVWRMLFNTALVVFCIALVEKWIGNRAAAYATGAVLAGVISLFVLVALPHSLAQYASGEFVGMFVRPLHGLWLAMTPVLWMLRGIDNVVRNAAGTPTETESAVLEQEIMSVVEEGEKEGIVDTQEREMIESVIEFRDTTAADIMTPRPQIVAIEADATLEQIRQIVEESGHSRIPVYRETLDQIVGILYARDLLRFLGQPTAKFDIKSAMRAPFYVPETKPSRDLLRDFRVQKVHIAIVLDEYGGTAGLVTIEDILEQIVGEISDEHEPAEPSMFKRINESTVEVDAQIELSELNRLTALSLPEDVGVTTLGGYLSSVLGRIPQAGTVYEQDGTKFTVLDAEPQRVKRVRIEQAMQPAVTPEVAEQRQ